MSANTGSVSYNSLLNCLIKTAKYRLTAKQKIILEELANNALNATRLVNYLASKLGCSKSALWNNIRQLKEIGLVAWNEKCELTEIGLMISKELGGDSNE